MSDTVDRIIMPDSNNAAETMASLPDTANSSVKISVTDGFSQTANVGLVANDTFKKMKVVAYKKVN